MYKYLNSSVAGKQFQLSAYKPLRGPRRMTALEGTSERDMFIYAPFSGDRSAYVELNGNNTAKNRQAAFTALFNKLQADGWLAPDQIMPKID